MKYVEWNYNDELVVPMLQREDGVLLVLPKTAQKVLGVSRKSVSALLLKYPEEIEQLSISEGQLEFVRAHREEFDVQVKRTSKMLTEDGFITLAVLVRSPQGRAMRRSFVQFIKENARRGYVTRAEWDDLLGRLALLESERQAADPFMSKTASLAGSLLQAQRGTKGIRDLN